MALTNLFKYIGEKIIENNSWIDSYAVNCIQLPNRSDGSKGEIVNFHGEEKEYLGLDDTKGNSFYIKIEPIFQYLEQRALTSCVKEFEVTINFKFVFFSINQKEKFDVFLLENLFANTLRQMKFNEYIGEERKIKIILQNSNVDAFSVFFDELGKKYDLGANAVCMSINGQLKYLSSNNCDECGIIVEDYICNQ